MFVLVCEDAFLASSFFFLQKNPFNLFFFIPKIKNKKNSAGYLSE